MSNQNKKDQASQSGSHERSKKIGGQDYTEPEPNSRSFSHQKNAEKIGTLHSKELLRQRNIFWAFTSLSTLALISIIYLLRVLTI